MNHFVRKSVSKSVTHTFFLSFILQLIYFYTYMYCTLYILLREAPKKSSFLMALMARPLRKCVAFRIKYIIFHYFFGKFFLSRLCFHVNLDFLQYH